MAFSKVILNGTTLMDVTQDTVAADKLLSSYTAHNAAGVQITGTATAGGEVTITEVQNTTGTTGVIDGDAAILTTKTITQNGTYAASSDNVDGYSSVTVNVSGGTPSATQHTIYFEFSDNTNTTINSWYDSSFISDAITATTPATYGQKTVTLAQLDGVTWYEYDPTIRYETLYEEASVSISPNGDGTGFCWIPALSSVSITDGSIWRITIDGDAYVSTAVYYSQLSGYGIPYPSSADFDFILYQGSGAWIVYVLYTDSGHISLKIERPIT